MGTVDVRITVTIDVNVTAWADEYGLERDRSIVREDLRDHLATTLHERYLNAAGLRLVRSVRVR